MIFPVDELYSALKDSFEPKHVKKIVDETKRMAGKIDSPEALKGQWYRFYFEIITNQIQQGGLFEEDVDNLGVLIPTQSNEEIVDLLESTVTKIALYCLRAVGEQIVSESDDDENGFQWTYGYQQFIFEIFRRAIGGAASNIKTWKQYKKNGEQDTDNENFLEILDLVEHEERRFAACLRKYARIRQDQMLLKGITNFEHNRTFSPSGYRASKEAHKNVITGKVAKTIPSFAFAANVLFYYETSAPLLYKSSSKIMSVEKLHLSELQIESLAYLVDDMYEYGNMEKAKKVAKNLLECAQKKWRVYKNALEKGRSPYLDFQKEKIEEDVAAWMEFRKQYLEKHSYYRYILLLEENQFAQLSLFLPYDQRKSWIERLQSESWSVNNITAWEWLCALPVECRDEWEQILYKVYGCTKDADNNVSKLLLVANHFICSLEWLFLFVLYNFGTVKSLSPDSMLRLLDEFLIALGVESL